MLANYPYPYGLRIRYRDRQIRKGVPVTTASKDRLLVVIELAGGNDTLNTVIPYNDGRYYDYRSRVGIDQGSVLTLNDELGLNPNLAPIKELWDQGKVGIINGIGYTNPNRSHFRSMDIWHTAEPTKIAKEGWLGRTVRELDPSGENVLTGVNFGRGLPRAFQCQHVPVASVGDLDTYGLYPDVHEEQRRRYYLDAFAHMYGGAEGKDVVMDFLSQTGADALKGSDIVRTAPKAYTSSVEYGDNPLAQNLKNAAQVMFADLGTRVYYTQHGSFDTHAGELPAHAKLWQEVSSAVTDFMDDAKEHGRQDDFVIFMYSEFGRRIQDNGTGTDHGSGGTAFVIGNQVKGGMYGEYPSLDEDQQLNGDLQANNDFRSTYSTLLDEWMGFDAAPIVNGKFDHHQFIKA